MRIRAGNNLCTRRSAGMVLNDDVGGSRITSTRIPSPSGLDHEARFRTTSGLDELNPLLLEDSLYNLASKIVLPLFFNPLAIAILLLVGGYLIRNRGSRMFQFAYWAGVLLLVVPGCPAVEERLTRSLEEQYPDAGAESYPAAQAIVVLGGTIHIPSGTHHSSGIIGPSDRLLKALRLYHAGKAPLVIVSGGNNPLSEEAREQPEAQTMRSLLEEWGIPEAAIQVESGSINTRENAVFSHRLLAERGIVRIILVTSAFHMPRAAATFRKVGFEVTAAPADFQTGWNGSTSIFDWIPDASALVGSSKAIHEWLGLWVYRLSGWV